MMLVFRAKIAVIQRRSSNIVQLQRHVVQAFVVVGVPGLPLVSPLVGGEQCGCVAHPEQDGLQLVLLVCEPPPPFQDPFPFSVTRQT